MDIRLAFGWRGLLLVIPRLSWVAPWLSLVASWLSWVAPWLSQKM